MELMILSIAGAAIISITVTFMFTIIETRDIKRTYDNIDEESKETLEDILNEM